MTTTLNMTNQRLEMLEMPATPTNESICGPKRHESAVDHEYPKSLPHSQQTSSVTRHRHHTQPISWGGRPPPHLGDRGHQSESLFELLCSPSACLGPFWRETSLTIAITVRFHSSLVCIDAHDTEHDQATTGNVGHTVNAHQRVHFVVQKARIC